MTARPIRTAPTRAPATLAPEAVKGVPPPDFDDDETRPLRSHARQGSAGSRQRERIRVVMLDDNAMLLRVMARSVAAENRRARADRPLVEFETAETAESLRELCAQGRRPDLVLCDYRLSGTTSTAVVRELVTAGHRVVVATGSPFDTAGQLGGIAPVEAKPLSLERLYELALEGPEDTPGPALKP